MTAGQHHFAYLFDGSRKGQTKVAADRLETLSKIAAKRYIDERAALNDTITKLAKENDLNPEQIRRVCEMANIETHKGLWSKTASKSDVSFPLADAKTVLACCGGEPSCPVTIDSDYAGPPKGIPSSADSVLSMIPGGGHDGLTQEPDKKRIIIMIQKKAAERANLRSTLLYKGMQLEGLKKQAYAAVKQAVLGGLSFRDLYKAACAGGKKEIADELLPEFENKLIAETHGDIRRRLEKTAISRAPADLISDNLGNVTIINGAHPVMILLDTVQARTGEIKNGLHNILRIDDELKIFNQKMHEL